MKKIIAPYGKTLPLLSVLPNLECWNFTTKQNNFELPAGSLVRAEYASDETHTVVMLVDETGKSPGIMLTEDDGSKRYGYRFVADNEALGVALGVDMPKKTYDLVGNIIAHETGELNEKGTAKLFSHLRKTGIGNKLQGHYSSRM